MMGVMLLPVREESFSMKHPGVEGVLRSGGVETRYRRAGTGPPVLLLEGSAEGGPGVEGLFEALAPHFRVIRPFPPRRRPARRPPGPFLPDAAWLRGVVDGLGLERCPLVADRASGLAAVWFAFTDPLRVSALALLVPEPSDPALPAGEVCRILAGTGQPVMLVRTHPSGIRGGLSRGRQSALVRFLREVGGAGDADRPVPFVDTPERAR